MIKPAFFLVASALLLTAALGASAAVLGEEDEYDALAAVPDVELDQQRGGFLEMGEFKISIGIFREVFVNGELVATSGLNIPDLSSALKGIPPKVEVIVGPIKIEALNISVPKIDVASGAHAANTGALPANGSANSGLGLVQPPVPMPPLVGSAANAQTSSSLPAPNATTASTPRLDPAASTAIAVQAPVAPARVELPTAVANLIQIGPGNTFAPNLSQLPALTNVIQNTLNNQLIQNITHINATVQSLQLMRALELNLSLSNMLGRSAR